MRPYLAIIKDSFRAAMASRVLYVLLALITLLLAALAPLHVEETLDWKLNRDFNVPNPELVMRQIVNTKDSSPSSRVWELLSEKTRTKMESTVKKANEATGDEEPKQSVEELFLQNEMVEALNKVMESPDFYRAEDWKGRNVPREAQEFIDSGVEDLTDIRSKRLNRLLISSIYSSIDQGNASALLFKYAVWEFPAPLSMTHEQFAQTLTATLPWWFEKVILAAGLLIAIIVTANMIPETFEPGSLNLLLSKPISRWGLFVSKFAGGCVFIALCAAYLFFGLWLWLGLGMGVWDRAMLLSIPLYVIVFAIYFSVSSVVGLVWRSAIVSVILTLLFWAFCFSIGWIYYWADTKMDNSELVHLFAVEENVYPADIIHQLKSWDKNEGAWEDSIEANLGAEGEIQFMMNSFMLHFKDVPVMPGMSNFLAPLHDQSTSRIFGSRYELGRSATSGTKKLLVSDDSGPLRFKSAGTFPNDTVKIFKSASRGIIAVNTNGIFYQLNEELLEKNLAGAKFETKKSDTDKPEDKAPGATKQVDTGSSEETPSPPGPTDEKQVEDEAKSPKPVDKVETDLPEEKPPELWMRVGPKRAVSLRSADDVSYSAVRDEFVIYRRGELNVYKLGEIEVTDEEATPPKTEMVLSMNLHAKLPLALGFDKGMSSRLSFGGNTIMIAFGNGKVITVDAQTLTEKNEYQPEKRSGIVTVTSTSDGRYFGALYRNGNLWLLDTQSDAKMFKASVTGQGDVCGVAFGDSGAESKLWVTENTDRVAGYNLSDNSMIDRHVPAGGMVEKAYRYAIRPFYRICPKPSEFYKVVTHLSSSGDTEANEDVDMNKTSQASDPWSPLWSGLIFMFGMLFIGCVIFHFKDY